MTDAMPTTRFIRLDAPVRGHDGVALVTIDRPDARNALTFALLAELADTLEELDRDGRTRVAILTGAGDRAFAAGADIVELADQTPERLRSERPFDTWDRLWGDRHPADRRSPRVRPWRRLRAGHDVRPDRRR